MEICGGYQKKKTNLVEKQQKKYKFDSFTSFIENKQIKWRQRQQNLKRKTPLGLKNIDPSYLMKSLGMKVLILKFEMC